MARQDEEPRRCGVESRNDISKPQFANWSLTLEFILLHVPAQPGHGVNQILENKSIKQFEFIMSTYSEQN